jgi:hypothetical protein
MAAGRSARRSPTAAVYAVYAVCAVSSLAPAEVVDINPQPPQRVLVDLHRPFGIRQQQRSGHGVCDIIMRGRRWSVIDAVLAAPRNPPLEATELRDQPRMIQ